MKQARYYKIVDGVAYVYAHPYPEHSVSVSIVSVPDLAYYRANFNLQKVWDSSKYVRAM